MNFIIEFYQSLDPLNTIIFWGVIIIFLLLIVFIILMINKNKRIKTESNHKNYHDELYSDEIALPSNSRDTLIMKDENLLIQEEKQTTFEPFVIPEPPINNELVEVEKTFKAEEHVMKYDNELFNLSHVKKNSELPPEEKTKESTKEKPAFQMPTRPYERNVLREMSLSQTSPIGIVKNDQSQREHIIKPVKSYENQISIEKNHSQTKLENSVSVKPVQEKEQAFTKINETKQSVNLEPINFKEQKEPPLSESLHKNYDSNESLLSTHSSSESRYKSINDYPIEVSIKEKLSTQENNSQSSSTIEPQTHQENAKFLEEVSRKLAEADIPDEIDRTAYELQQEEDAIISYKELMAKKDTIKTIDEEDAVISIKELTERQNPSEKLYNITEEEENNEFIDELKKFRNDLN